MNIRIKATDYQMTPEVSDYLDERLLAIQKMLAGEAELTRCEVEIGRAAGGQRHGEHMWFAEINLIYPGGEYMRATNHAPNVNTAIEDAKEEVLRQIRKQKQVHMRVLRKGGALWKRMTRFARED
jgi:ribosomal subunit interface protein